jgi:hypothetical protein
MVRDAMGPPGGNLVLDRFNNNHIPFCDLLSRERGNGAEHWDVSGAASPKG